MTKRMIEPVSNNEEKRITFKRLKGRYKKAIESGFYFEAMTIAYALLEDRLKAFLYYSGAINDRKSHKITRKNNRVEALKKIAKAYPDEKGNTSLGITAIKGKIRIVRALVLWEVETEGVPEDKYLEILKKEYERSLDDDALIACLEQISLFCDYRNEVVHAAFNKNIAILDEGIGDKVRDVMREEAFLETQVNALKKNNRIRKMMNLGNN